MMEDESDCKKKELDFFIRMIILLPLCLYHIIAIYQSVILKSSIFYLPTAYVLCLSGTKALREDEHT